MFSYFNYKSVSHRAEQQQPKDAMETPKPHPDTAVIRSTSHSEHEYDDDDDEIDTDPLIDELANNNEDDDGERMNSPTEQEVCNSSHL